MRVTKAPTEDSTHARNALGERGNRIRSFAIIAQDQHVSIDGFHTGIQEQYRADVMKCSDYSGAWKQCRSLLGCTPLWNIEGIRTLFVESEGIHAVHQDLSDKLALQGRQKVRVTSPGHCCHYNVSGARALCVARTPGAETDLGRGVRRTLCIARANDHLIAGGCPPACQPAALLTSSAKDADSHTRNIGQLKRIYGRQLLVVPVPLLVFGIPFFVTTAGVLQSVLCVSLSFERTEPL